jgi:sigma-E factor negative regulatory protein RseC
MQDKISHTGVVQKIENGTLFVTILSQSACAACHAKGACGMSESTEKIVEVAENLAPDIKPGEHVEVLMERTMGMKAVIFGYGLPFLILLSVLIAVFEITGKELLAGLSAILSLVPYYLGLCIFKNKLHSAFSFTVRKL